MLPLINQTARLISCSLLHFYANEINFKRLKRFPKTLKLLLSAVLLTACQNCEMSNDTECHNCAHDLQNGTWGLSSFVFGFEWLQRKVSLAVLELTCRQCSIHTTAVKQPQHRAKVGSSRL